MWSLPDIVRLNEEAASATLKSEHEDAAQKPEEHDCEVCGWNGEEKKADYGYPWYDIFSDDPKGAIFVCEQHDGYTGSPLEGYFTCGVCQRVFIENYTWELYYTIVEGEQLCIPCALQHYLREETNWIAPNAVNDVVLEPDSASEDLFEAETGVLNLAKCQHLIANSMTVPSTIKFVENLEFDSITGGLLASYSSTHDTGVGESAALRVIRGLGSEGYSKVLLILDGAYQFSVSIGIYVPAEEHAQQHAQQHLEQTRGH